MDVVDEGTHVLDRRAGQDAVAQVEDVAGTASRAPQDVVHAGQEALARGEEQRRIEVALDGDVGPRALPALVEWRPPVDADDGAAGLALDRQQVAGGRPEVDLGHIQAVEPVEDPPDVGEHELQIVLLVERPDPRVEHLHRLGSSLDLGPQVIRDHVGEKPREEMPRLRLGVHEPLRLCEVARTPALDGVGGERERGPREANEGDLQFTPQEADGLEDHPELLAGLEAPQRLHVGS